jgi:TetR/AcrR family transcriptional regulator
LPTTKTEQTNIRRNRQYEKRLNSILKAASTVIAKDGYEGASVRKVAARAGVGLSGIYYYFKNKDELLYAIQKNTFTTLVDLLKERLSGLDDPKDRLRLVIENHIEFFVNNINDLKVCVHEIESLSGAYYKDVLKIRQEYFRLVKDIITENVPKGEKLDPALVSLYLFGSLNWIYMWYNPQINSDVSVLTDNLMTIFTKGIKAT